MIFWTLISTALALGPVLDFRVPDMARAVSGSAKTVQYIQPSVEINKVLSLKLHQAPVITINDSILPLWTDPTNSIYYVNLTVGPDGASAEFPLLLDTGSGVSWVLNDLCSGSACSNAAKFSLNVKTTSSLSLLYSGSHVSGKMVDTVENDLEFVIGDKLHLSNYSFGLALTAPDVFLNFNLSGILGVQARYDDLEKSNMLHQLYCSGAIDAMQFATVLGGPSNNSFGGLFITGKAASNYASTLATSDLEYCNVLTNDQLFWMLNITGVDSQQGSAINSSKGAIIDTGTTGMALPKNDATALHKAVFGSDYIGDDKGNYAFRCNATGNISFSIDNHDFVIPISSIKALAYELSVLQGYCASKVQGMDLQNWVLGASFLSNFYTVFDLEHSRVGFAPRVESYLVGNLSSSLSLIQSLSQSQSSSLSPTPTSSKTSQAFASSSSGAHNNTTKPAKHDLAANLPHASYLAVLAFSLLLVYIM